MFGEFELQELSLNIKRNREKVENFLSNNGLRFEEMDIYCAFFDSNDAIVAGGGVKDDVLKCIAVDNDAKSNSLSNAIISRLRQIANENGFPHTRVFTKPENLNIFESLGYRLIGSSPYAILLESNSRGISDYVDKLKDLYIEGYNGIIVMNCNPLTEGHKYLINEARKKVDNLYIIPLPESNSEFSFEERFGMLKEFSNKFQNVIVCPSSDYLISNITFPSYFLKKISDATDSQINMDINIFVNHIAPAIGCKVRFVGSEPTDLLTARYNELLKDILPSYNIRLEVLERKETSPGNAISASKIRNAVEAIDLKHILSMISIESLPYLLAHLAIKILRTELNLTPKPGLVDLNNSGSHKDMNYSLMSESIESLKEGFIEIGRLGCNCNLPSAKEIIKIGKKIEGEMLRHTGNINTYKGAVFSLGLALITMNYLLYNKKEITVPDIMKIISELTSEMTQDKASNGGRIIEKFAIKGALQHAKSGYEIVFNDFLPYLKSIDADEYKYHKLLLRIMERLDDTNVFHRAGKDGSDYVKQASRECLQNFSIERLDSLDEKFIRKNISPGGAADMFSLTLFFNSFI